MNSSQLLAELERLGVRLEAHDNRLRFTPASAVTTEILGQMKAHKSDLLETLAERDWTAGSVHPDTVPVCRTCGRQEAWQTLLGNWRCLRCDPPKNARRLRMKAEWLRQ